MNDKELVTLPPRETALSVFTAPNGLDPYLDQVKEVTKTFVTDLTTRKGREQIASNAFKIAKMKTALDALGKELADEQKDIPKKIDAERKRMREFLDSLRDEVRKPLTDWEQAEERRIANHQAGIEWFRLRTVEIHDLDIDELRATITEVEAKQLGAAWEEFESEAQHCQKQALSALRAKLADQIQREAEQAELAKLRAEAAERERVANEERIAQQAAAAAREEAERKAQAERDAAARREAEALETAARAEKEKLEAQRAAEKAAADAAARAQAAVEAERRRVAEERRKAEADEQRRKADLVHRARVNRAALDSLVDGGIPEEYAKRALILIAQGRIPAVSISY